MPLENQVLTNNYIRVSKIFVSSADRNENSEGPYRYQVDLKDELQNVVAIEITGYSFPSEIAPTFVAPGPGFTGTYALDFEITTGALTKQFTAFWPERQFSYENVTVPYLSYIQTLQQILNLAILNDADFGTGGAHEAFFASVADPQELSRVLISGPGVTGFRYIFATGPNRDDAAFNAMGFNRVDTAFALEVVSPTRTNLKPFRHIDINLSEVPELIPLRRVYTTDNIYYGTVRNDPGVTRTRLLSSHPIRKLNRMNITITLEGGVVPPVFQGLDHELTFTVFQLSNEETVPDWVQGKQVFVL